MWKIVWIVLGTLIVLVAAGWLGLRVKPKPFPPYPERTPALETVALPAGLPAPVERFYRTLYGDRVPVIESAVTTGRATMRVSGITFPARFRFTHLAGQGYRHYIEATFFGIPLMKVNERYLDGQARMELPGSVIENEPKVDQAANLGLWAESVWLPSLFVADPRVRWEAVDESTARLIVPFDSPGGEPSGDGEDTFTVTFAPQTGLIVTLEADRYREATDEAKIPWRNETLDWREIEGHLLPRVGTVTWMDEGTPWAVFTIEQVVYNVDVTEYIRARGL
jgi:hypothetical protein